MVGRFVEIVSTNVLLVARRGRFSVYQGDDRIDVFHAAVSFFSIIHNRYSGGNDVHLVGSILYTRLPSQYVSG